MKISDIISGTLKDLQDVVTQFSGKKTPVGANKKLKPVLEAITIAVKESISRMLIHEENFGDAENETISLFSQNIMDLPESEKKEEIKQQLRFLLLAINNRKEKFTTPEQKQNFIHLYTSITQLIGAVPRLNDDIYPIKLPDDEFLPTGFFKRWNIDKKITPERWAAIKWEDPSRNSSEIEFFTKEIIDEDDQKHDIASVRLHLIDQEGCDGADGTEALSFSDLDYCPVGDLVADHMQPSEDLLYRQLELIKAMNLDPIFKKEMEEIDAAQALSYFESLNLDPTVKAEMRSTDPAKIFRYFTNTTEDGTSTSVGTKWYYMRYHNCIDNLWFITPKKNSGKGKLNQDPIEWLRENAAFGAEFFAHIGGEASISKTGVFYICTSNNRPLAKIAYDWYIEHYKQEIVAAGYMRSDIRAPLRAQFEILAKGTKKQRLDMFVRFGLISAYAQRAEHSTASSPRHSQGGYDSSDVEMSAANLQRMHRAIENKKDELDGAHKEVKHEYLQITRDEKGKNITVEAIPKSIGSIKTSAITIPDSTTASLMRTLSPMVRDDYWYTSEEIQTLLRKQISSEQANVLAAQTPLLKTEAPQLFQETVKQALLEDKLSVIPISLIQGTMLDEYGLPQNKNVGKGHWVGLVIRPNSKNRNEPSILYIDSLGNGTGIDEDVTSRDLIQLSSRDEGTPTEGIWHHISTIVGLLRGIALPQAEGAAKQINPHITVTGLVQQSNGADCGAFLVQNLVSQVNNTAIEAPLDKSAHRIRQDHARLLSEERAFSTQTISPPEEASPAARTGDSTRDSSTIPSLEKKSERKRKYDDAAIEDEGVLDPSQTQAQKKQNAGDSENLVGLPERGSSEFSG